MGPIQHPVEQIPELVTDPDPDSETVSPPQVEPIADEPDPETTGFPPELNPEAPAQG